jgi:hypothetical protein
MKTLPICITFAVLTAGAFAQPAPRIVQKDGKYTLLVDGRPHIVLGAQLGNSSGWPSALEEAWPQLKQMNVNTAEVPVYWETIEPQPGQYDFTLVDQIIQGARQNNLRLILLWFGTWKNGVMDYAPPWVKQNLSQYPRMIGPAGKPVRVLSPHSKANLDSDRRAFTRLMEHLAQADKDRHTVIMVQVENEPGSLDTVRDYSEEANKLFAGQVPAALVSALKKKPGTWSQVFGADAEEAFAAYHVASYVNEVAAAGKKVNPLPLYVNVWLRERKAFMRPGEAYPSGGATSNMLDIWKAVTPAIDVIAPDIYVADYVGYREVCQSYKRPDNPLLIPETGGTAAFARYMFYALADFDAIGFAPFGVNRPGRQLVSALSDMAANYRLLSPAIPAIAELQGTGRLKAAVEEESLTNRLLVFDRYEAVAYFGTLQSGYGGYSASGTQNRTGRVMIGQLAPDEFLVAGFDASVAFRPRPGSGSSQAQFLRVEEGTYEDGKWTMTRLWNGDQTFFFLRLPSTGVILRARLMAY